MIGFHFNTIRDTILECPVALQPMVWRFVSISADFQFSSLFAIFYSNFYSRNISDCFQFLLPEYFGPYSLRIGITLLVTMKPKHCVRPNTPTFLLLPVEMLFLQP